MTSWVVSIDKAHSGHWAIAKKQGFWDLSKDVPIAQGDLVYFWQARKSFVAQTRATTSAQPISPGAPASWEDSGTRAYVARFEFEVIDESPNASPKWIIDIGPQLSGKTPDLRNIPGFDDPGDEAVLASFFGGVPSAGPAPEPDSPMERELKAILDEMGIDVPGLDIASMSEDAKRVVERLVVVRDDQRTFRADLISAYGACAVSGSTVEPALEAAHIRPYGGEKSHHVTNGLLLRSDLHRLFDRHLLTVTPEHVVRVSPDLNDPFYTALEGGSLRALPSDEGRHPNRKLLSEHNAKCAWLV